MSANPKPLLTLHVGQAGIQIGHAIWELICLEHNVSADGQARKQCDFHGNLESVFVPSPQDRLLPRAVFVDSDPGCVDEVRSGPYRGLFCQRQLLSDCQDAGANYTTGRYNFNRRLAPDTVDRPRWLAEKTDVQPAVCLVHSSCGGTGSGFSVACLSRAADELGLRPVSVLDLCVVPGRTASQNSCELLNTALYLDESQEFVRQTLCVSNSALFRVCAAQLQSEGGATFAHVNRVLAAAFSNLTATERLPGASVSLSGIMDSLLPYPHLKFPLLACAPFLTAETARTDIPTAKSATTAVLEVGSQFLDVDPRRGRHAAGFLLYRGRASLGEAHRLASEVGQRDRAQFYDWAPPGFRAGLVSAPPLAPPGSGFADSPVSVTMVTTHSGLSNVFIELADAAHRLYDEDVFVHNYEGAIVALLAKSEVGLQRHSHGTRSTETSHVSLPELAATFDEAPATTSRSTPRISATIEKENDTSGPTAGAAPTGRNNSVRHWMSPTAAQRSGNSEVQLQEELRQHLRRRMLSGGPGPHRSLSRQQQQQHPPTPQDGEASPIRAGALSDVFGVRVRVSMAIDYLERVARYYRENAMGQPLGSSSSEEDNGEGAVAEVSAAPESDRRVQVVGFENDDDDGSEAAMGLAESDEDGDGVKREETSRAEVRDSGHLRQQGKRLPDPPTQSPPPRGSSSKGTASKIKRNRTKVQAASPSESSKGNRAVAVATSAKAESDNAANTTRLSTEIEARPMPISDEDLQERQLLEPPRQRLEDSNNPSDRVSKSDDISSETLDNDEDMDEIPAAPAEVVVSAPGGPGRSSSNNALQEACLSKSNALTKVSSSLRRRILGWKKPKKDRDHRQQKKKHQQELEPLQHFEHPWSGYAGNDWTTRLTTVSQLDENSSASTQDSLTAARHPAIVAAERILLKYQHSFEDF